MAAELPRPGVEVIQVFRSVSPTVITPTLVPCVVGVCRQVVDVFVQNEAGSQELNQDAIVPLQAAFVAKAATGTPPKYGGLDGLALIFSVNNAPDITVTFSGALLTPAQVVAQVRNALAAAGNTTATAEVVGDSQWRLRTFGADDNQQIEVKATSGASVLTAFGIGPRVYLGASYYAGWEVNLPTAAFPDPRSNLEQLAFDTSTIRAFMYMGGSGGSVVEISKNSSFLRYNLATAAVRTGSVDLTGLTLPGDIATNTLVLAIDGGADLTVTFSNPANPAAILSQINAVIGAVATATLAAGSNFLVITTVSKNGVSSSVQIKSGTAMGTLGLTANTVTGTAAAEATDDGNGDTITPLLKIPNQNLTAAGTAAVVTGTLSIAGGVPDGETLIVDDGTGPQTISFLGAGSSANVLTQINAILGPAAGGHVTATVNGSTFLVLTSDRLGLQSKISILGGTALATLGLTAGVTYGGPFPVKVGDEIYVDGLFYASVTQVAPGAVTTTVKIDKQVPISSSVGNSMYIIAKNLPDATAPATRPYPDLVVNSDGSVSVKLDLLRTPRGEPLQTTKAQLAISYKAVRKDVTAVANSPALLRFNDTVALSSQLSPINTDNPLGLGLYFALLNAPGTQVTGLGVDAASASAPEGTVEAFTRAATFLEAFEVYAVAPMTHDSTVGQVFATHASVMSNPENKGERIALFAPKQPSAKLDTLVGSGLSGNSTGTSNVFDTGIANLGSLLLAQGLDPSGSYLVETGLHLDIGDGKKYSITSVSGGLVTVKVSFITGENDDGYYATTNLPTTLINQVFAVRIRGASLTLTDGTLDKEALAVTYQKMAQAYQNRRFWHVIGPQAAATLGGLEQIISGFYLCAGVAGMVGKQPPQQSFTNFPMTGFTRVIGTNGFLSERQLNVAAAGGNYVIVQDEASSPLISRHALTTDMTSIETRTDSITKVIDFCAKFLRRGLKNFIGRFNITQGFLDSLGHVIQGLLGFLAESGVLIGSQLNNIIQDEDAPDTVLVDITLDVPFPCNYIRLTLVV
jgi:hypothetical protein